jgi:predicted GNAT family acetyltransferase
MIRKFTPADEQTILNFAYTRERENMFVIGSFRAYPDPFKRNVYLGYYEGDKLIGIGTHFGRFGSLVVNAQNSDVLNAMVDAFVSQDVKVEGVPCFRRYGIPIVERLRTHGIEPKVVRDETVYLLTKETFFDHSTGETVKPTEADVDEIITLGRVVDGEDPAKEITEREREQISISEEWILRKEGKIVSKATIHGVSKHYTQIGGVMTHPDYQGKGYAKQTVSAVSKYWIDQGKQIILFSRNDNIPAMKVYKAIGFQPIDDYIIAEYV